MVGCSSVLTEGCEQEGRNPLGCAMGRNWFQDQAQCSQQPLAVPHLERITKDHTGGAKTLREEEHLYWNKDLDQKCVGEANKGEAEEFQWDNLRRKNGEKERKHKAGGKRKGPGMAGKNMTSLRNPRSEREEGAVIPEKKGTYGKGWSSRRERARRKGGKAAKTRQGVWIRKLKRMK